jgi:hypothetical protein
LRSNPPFKGNPSICILISSDICICTYIYNIWKVYKYLILCVYIYDYWSKSIQVLYININNICITYIYRWLSQSGAAFSRAQIAILGVDCTAFRAWQWMIIFLMPAISDSRQLVFG